MAEHWYTSKKDDAIDILKADHDRVEDLFKQFEKSEDPVQQRQLAVQAMTELKVHAILEEEIFYPTVRARVGNEIMDEADEEHHVVKVLISELEAMGTRPTGSDGHYTAKFTVLAENVRHHVKEEEREMLPKARKADVDMQALGRRMLERKEQLLRSGVPPAMPSPMAGAA
jgi:iron-sulfur cluster repair protein YtfE (RIC family)